MAGFIEMVNKIRAKFDEFKKMLGDNAEKINEFKESAKKHFTNIYNSIRPVMEKIAELISQVLQLIKTYWDNWGSMIVANLKLGLDTVILIFQQVMSSLETFLDVALGILTLDFERAFGAIQKHIQGTMDRCKNIFRNAVNSILNGANALIEQLNKILKTPIQPITLWADTSNLDDGGDVIIEVEEKVSEVSDSVEEMSLVFDDVFDGIQDGAGDAALSLEGLQEAYTGVGESAKSSSSKVEDAAEAAKKAEEERIARVLDKTVHYADAVSQALKNMYQEEYDLVADKLSEQLTLIKNKAYDELEIVSDTSNDKIKLLNDEYLEKIRLIDESTAAALSGINAEIDAELERLGIINAGRAEEIQRLRERKNAIKEETELERKLEEEKRFEKDKTKLLEQIAAEETAEKRAELEERLFELEEKRKKTLRDEERKAEEKALDEQIKNLQTAQTEEIKIFKQTVEEKQKIQDEILDNLSGSKDLDKKTAKDNLDKLSKMAPEYAAALVTSGKEGQRLAMEALELYYPDWYKAGLSMVDYIQMGIADKGEDLEGEMTDIGVLSMEGWINGFLAKEDELIAEAARIAQRMLDVISSTLEIASPSRKTFEQGKYTAMGLSTGMEHYAGLVESAAQKLGIAAVPETNSIFNTGGADSVSGGVSAVTDGGMHIHLHIGNFFNNTDKDIETLSEELSSSFHRKLRGRAG